MITEDNMPEELKGDIIPEINPEKLFDEKEYSTIILGEGESSKKDLNNIDYITVLIHIKSTREEKDEALMHLKQNKAQAFILNAISKTKNESHKALLIAACWEAGLDFKKDFLFFVNLIASKNFTVSFEAFTVIQEMDSYIDVILLNDAFRILQAVKEPSITVSDAIIWINTRL